MNMELKAELVMAVRGYECEGKQDCGEGVDLTASDAESDEKILLRVISDSGSSSGTIGVEAVRKLVEDMKQENYDKGVIVGERFSVAARRETYRESIEIVSENLMPFFSQREIYLAMEDRVNHLCRKKCRRVPKKRSDCKGKDSEGHYSCRIRQINDNAMFHLQRGWTDLLRQDLLQILALENGAGKKRMS